MSKKKILLAAPNSFNIYQPIVKNLEFWGYEVTHIEDHGYGFKYSSLGQRLRSFFKKVVFNDKEYKTKLKVRYNYTRQSKIIADAAPFDIALVFRADFFDRELVKEIQASAEQSISFHFDGVGRDPVILDYVQYFDRFYVFDKEDLVKYPSYGLLYSPNFYFDYPEKSDPETVYDVYYVSSFQTSRVDHLLSLYKQLVGYYSKVKFVVIPGRVNEEDIPEFIHQNMEIQSHHVSFEEQLAYVRNAKVIIDLVLSDHNGYSFRIIEGIKYGKKVITTNATVVDADFYHPNNFFIWTLETADKLADFLETPYHPLPAEVRSKYGFSAWLEAKLLD